MKHEIITTMEQWTALRSEWDALLAGSRASSVFMTWAWLDTWLSIQVARPSIFVICVRNAGGQLIGVAPYYRNEYVLMKTIHYRVFRFIGDVDSGAEYQTWITDRADENRACEEIASALRELKSNWDLLWMPKLDAWTGANEPMIAALKAAGFGVNTRPVPFSSIPLPAKFDDYLARMSANRRQQVRRMTKKIRSKPDVEVRKIVSQSELASALESLFELHNKRWGNIGQQGAFLRNPKEREFYERFVPKALDEGWLAMYMLLDAGVPKAVQIGYKYRGMLLQLQEGFDPDYSDHVGNALRAFVLEECIKEGLLEYDFLGGVSEHKRRWLADERDGMDVLAAAARPKNLPLVRMKVWPTGCFLRPRTVD